MSSNRIAFPKGLSTELLIVVDLQSDFIDGVLGSPEAAAMLPHAADFLRRYEESYPDAEIYYTRDTHGETYLQTQEGRKLPVPHCIRDSDGWQIHPLLQGSRQDRIFDKPTFGSTELCESVVKRHKRKPISRITLLGVCTDICVISNAMLLKAALPEAEISILADYCAGVTPQRHETALQAMSACQIEILR